MHDLAPARKRVTPESESALAHANDSSRRNDNGRRTADSTSAERATVEHAIPMSRLCLAIGASREAHPRTARRSSLGAMYYVAYREMAHDRFVVAVGHWRLSFTESSGSDATQLP